MNQYVVKAAMGTIAAMMLSVASHAATIWQPTDVLETGNVNIVQVSPGLSLNGGTLALFEDADDYSGTALALGSDGGTFEFTDNLDGTFSVEAIFDGSSIGGPLVIMGSEFMLGVSWDDGANYNGDVNVEATPSDPTSFVLIFADGQTNRGMSLVVDVSIVDPDPPEVPLPAAAWLFGSALLGLIAVRRRKA